MKKESCRNRYSRGSVLYGNIARFTEGSSNQPRLETRKSHRPRRKRTPEKSADEDYTLSPWLDLLPEGMKFSGAEHKLHHEILAYLAYMEETQEEKMMRQKAIAEIRRVVHGRFRNAQVLVFGSSMTGLSLPTSDIDVALMMPHLGLGDATRTLFQLSHKFTNSQAASDVSVNHYAHIPILKLTMSEYYGSFSVDISINNTIGTQGVEVTKEYVARIPALRPLVLLLKAFLRQRGLNDASKGGLSSHALTCLCIHFLQSNPGRRPQDLIEKPTESESFGILFSDFIYYYGFTFPYTTSYISVTTSPGELLPKSDVSNALSVRCLVNPENEIAKSMNKMKAFVQAFKDVYATVLGSTRVEENLLGNVIRVNRKFVARRALLSASHPHNLPTPTP